MLRRDAVAASTAAALVGRQATVNWLAEEVDDDDMDEVEEEDDDDEEADDGYDNCLDDSFKLLVSFVNLFLVLILGLDLLWNLSRLLLAFERN